MSLQAEKNTNWKKNTQTFAKELSVLFSHVFNYCISLNSTFLFFLNFLINYTKTHNRFNENKLKQANTAT